MLFLRWAKNLALVACLLLASGAAEAASIEVTPVIVTLQPGHLFATLTVNNHSDDTTAVQLRPFSWSQTATEDALAPNNDLIVSPPIFQLGPHEQQTVRVLLRRAPNGAEATYRLLLDQLPAAGEAGKVQFALRLSMPIFAAPDSLGGPALSWRLVDGAAGPELRVRNNGGRHVRISDITLHLPDGRELRCAMRNNPYVLAGVERSLPLRLARLPEGGTATVSGHDDAGVIAATVPVGQGS